MNPYPFCELNHFTGVSGSQWASDRQSSHQSQNREGTRAHRAAVAAYHRRRGDRINASMSAYGTKRTCCDRFSCLLRSVGLRDGRNHPIKAHLHLARQVTKTGQSRPACIPERSLAAKLARFCIQYLPLGGRGYGDKRKCVNTSTSLVRAAARLCSLRGQHSTRNYCWRHSNVSRVALP